MLQPEQQQPSRANPVSSNNTPYYDPSANVLSLVEASITRINDLNTIRDRRLDDLEKAERSRVDQMVQAEVRRIDEVAALRERYTEMLAGAEAKRIDAIRAVDTAAVQASTARATEQAAILASQVQQVTEQLSERVAAMEKAINIGSGKETVSDPMVAQMSTDIKSLLAALQTTTGKTSGISAAWAVMISAVMLIGGIIAIVITFTQ